MPKVLPEYKEQAAQKILLAAQTVFAEKGYHEARMEDIAEKVGVSKRTLYIYFKDKDDLFNAICAEGPKEMLGMMKDPASWRPEGRSRTDFIQICEDFFDNLVAKRFAGFRPGSIDEFRLNHEMIAAASRNATLKKVVRESRDKQTEILSRFLQSLKEKGTIRQNLEATAMARAVMALYDGLVSDIIIGVEIPEVRKAWLGGVRAIVGEAPAKK